MTFHFYVPNIIIYYRTQLKLGIFKFLKVSAISRFFGKMLYLAFPYFAIFILEGKQNLCVIKLAHNDAV